MVVHHVVNRFLSIRFQRLIHRCNVIEIFGGDRCSLWEGSVEITNIQVFPDIISLYDVIMVITC